LLRALRFFVVTTELFADRLLKENIPMSSFTELLTIHDELNELFLRHQEALLQLDVPRAAVCLQDYERALHAHMRVEEQILLPIYERAGRIPGGPPEFFLGEHQRMREFVARFHNRLAELPGEPAQLPRRVIQLFDEEATYKALCDHHDQRERNLFFPALDRVTSEEERAELLARCWSLGAA